MTGRTTRVSVDSAGGEGNSGSSGAALSADGRYVAFASFASNLVPNDTNSATDIFVHDRESGETTRVSIDSAGGEGNYASGDDPFSVSFGPPALSADGRYVAFESYGSNLVAREPSSGGLGVFVHDRETGETSRVSVNSRGAAGFSDSVGMSLSADGRIVAFTSAANNLVPNDTNRYFVPYRNCFTPFIAPPSNYCGFQGIDDIFVHNRFSKGDLSIAIRPVAKTVRVGKTVKHTITVQNKGRTAVSGIRVMDRLPASLDFTSASKWCTYNTDTHAVTCSLGLLKPQKTASFPIKVVPSSAGVFSNTVTVDGDLLETKLSNNSRSAKIRVK